MSTSKIMYFIYLLYRNTIFSLLRVPVDLYHTYLTSRPAQRCIIVVVSSSCPRDGQLVYSRALTTVLNNLSLSAKSTTTI